MFFDQIEDLDLDLARSSVPARQHGRRRSDQSERSIAERENPPVAPEDLGHARCQRPRRRNRCSALGMETGGEAAAV